MAQQTASPTSPTGGDLDDVLTAFQELLAPHGVTIDDVLQLSDADVKELLDELKISVLKRIKILARLGKKKKLMPSAAPSSAAGTF